MNDRDLRGFNAIIAADYGHATDIYVDLHFSHEEIKFILGISIL